MAKKDRDTLKNYFKNGSLPSQESFSDLIDSSLNIIDEGFDKSVDEGLKVSALGDAGFLMSFFKNIPLRNPLWFMRLDAKTNNLILGNRRNPNAMSFTQVDIDAEIDEKDPECAPVDAYIGINKAEPKYALDVGGVIRAEGRTGCAEKEIPADGEWYNITDALTGCHAFEVMAGVGGAKKTGRYAMLHAIAMNTYNPRGWFFNLFNLKKRIKAQHAYYRSISDKLKLRWVGENRKYYLQLRVNSDYGEDIWVKYTLSKLWFDEDMGDSRG